MDKLIKKSYIIIKSGEKKKLRTITKNYKNTGLELKKWNKIDNNKLDDNKIEDLTTTSCNYLCSPKTIANWLSHYKLWKHIVKNEEDRVLILEDDTYPTKGFKKKLLRFWDKLPADWDLIYLGCSGTCKNDTATDIFYKITSGRSNTKVDRHIIKPGYPTGFYGYILSYEGAKKLIKNENFKKVHNEIDKHFANNIINTSNFNVYAFTPQLIFKNNNNNSMETHVIGNPIGESNALYYRPLDINISYFSVILMLIGLLVGMFGTNKMKSNFLVTSIILQLFEIAYTKTSIRKLKTLIVEVILICVFYAVGIKIKKLIDDRKLF